MPRFRCLVLALALLAPMSPVAGAQPPVPLGPVASPGWGEGVALARLPVGESGERSLLFLADIVAGLRIYDVTVPGEPSLLSSLLPSASACPSGFYADNVRVLGTRAYLAGGRCGVLAVDVSDPTSPEVALRVSSPIYAKDALPREVPGGVELLVADYNAGLRVIALPDGAPAPGFEQRFLLGPGQGISGAPLAVDADPESGIVVVATTLGVFTVSFDGPTPQAGPFLLTPPNLLQTAIPQDVAVRDDYAYVPLWQGGLVVIDLLNPSDPTPFGNPTVETPHAFFKTAVVSPQSCGELTCPAPTLLASEGQCGLAVFDVTGEGLSEREGSPIPVAGTDPEACGRQVTSQQIPFAWSLAEADGIAAVGFGAMAGGGGFELVDGLTAPPPLPLRNPDPRVAVQIVDAAADLDGDGVVGAMDVARVARAFGAVAGRPRYDAGADLDGDGVVGTLDLLRVARAFGGAPGP